MKTLRNHTILYDAECPMCNLYTGAFVKCGMLEQTGRQQFKPSARGTKVDIDWERAGTEIALVDHRHSTVYYGIDSLFKILGHSFPFLKPLFRNRIFRYLIRHLYFFISYNRKVIAPSSVFEGWADCRPVMNVPYRMAYLLVGFALLTLALASATGNVSWPHLAKAAGAAGIPLAVQAAWVYWLRKERLIYYMGNTMTVLIIATLMLFPVTMMLTVSEHPVVFTLIAGTMLSVLAVIHYRRCQTLGVRGAITLVWLLTHVAGLLLLIYR